MPMQIHVIQRGENLWLLSQRYGVSINQIVTANGLSDLNSLAIGQALVIPQPSEYVVKQGDNLWKIAQQFGTTVQAIRQVNHITNPNQIYVGQVLRIPEKYKPTIEVNAFTNLFNAKTTQEVRDFGHLLTYLSPFGYRMKSDGTLESINDTDQIQAASANQVVPMMVITNFSATEAGSILAHKILISSELQDKLLDNVISTMKSKGYHGLNIDFENVLPIDRELYNQFLQRAVNRLHAEKYFVSSSLAPKTSGEQKGLLYEAHDYRAHGEILDFVVLMTYEWGYRLGPPQAISPIDRIRAVLNYALSVIPRNKILMGLQLYARDWLLPHIKGQQAETFSMQEAVHRAIQNGAAIQYDVRSQSPFYRYIDNQGRTHEVWFEDARSTQAKFDLVKNYNLRGVSYWVLGYPFPQNWLLLDYNFRVWKL
jgi:spore germination protein